MSVIEFLLELKEKHVFVNQAEGKITVKGDREALVPELKELLAEYKNRIIETYESLDIGSNSQLAPTTFSQQRLWFIDQLEGNSVHYNMPAAMRLTGKIDLVAIHKAHNTILERHESLRTVFLSKGDEPYQIIREHKEVKVPLKDLSHLPRDELEKEVSRLCREESHKPFIIEKDLMLRWQVIKLSDEEYVLLRTVHHIASDGWSLGVLAKEFNTLYETYRDGKENPLPPLVIQFSDYAHWQRQWLKGSVLDSLLEYWTEQLAGIPAVHSLPLDRARPAIQSFRGKDYGCRISSEVTEAFNDLCFQNGATLFMGLHAVFSLLLSRYSGENDIVIGTPIANREQPDVAPLNGFFLNTLVLRSDLSVVDDFIGLLEQSKNGAWGAYAHQQVPFEKLVKVLDLEPSLSYSPVFQVMMILQNNDSSAIEVSESKVGYLNSDFDFAKFELTLNISQANDQLWLGWNYNTALFDPITIWRLATNFEVLLKAIITDPKSPLISMPLLNEEEYQYCTLKYNTTKIPYDYDLCVHELFENQVKLGPHKIALVSKDYQLSYSELNRRANRLAHFLISKGVNRNKLVGVCLPRCPDMIIAVLAILKAGGAYLPIDSSYPEKRVKQICDDAKLDIALTYKDMTLPTFAEFELYSLDSESLLISLSTFPEDNPTVVPSRCSSSDLAYVIYTSGSTGMPKGVMISHRNLHAYYTAAKSTYNVSVEDRVLQFSSFSFDIFVEETFTSLLTGASLILRTEEMLLGRENFWGFVEKQSLTIISLPTAFWHELCRQLESKLTTSDNLKLVVVGGESMSENMLDRWKKFTNDKTQLINTYGPTEATIIASAFDIDQLRKEHKSIPIGKPLPNMQCYVLNPAGEVCPIGVNGELYLGGDGIALGYLNNKELTQERFVKNPFSQQPNERLYRTGDIVRLLLDGNLEFIGRIDEQVKIRGFRIEVGEVEHRLSQCSGINDSMIFAIEEEHNEKRLIAYVIPEDEQSYSDSELVSQLRNELQDQLPDYMLPSAFVVVEQWPLTPNGKIDKQALPVPDVLVYQAEYVAPSTETEHDLVAIWGKLLKLDEKVISITTNFFELGGHSLLVIRLVAEISNHFSQEITVKSVFQRPDISALAQLIDSLIQRKIVLEKLANESDEDIEDIEW